MRVSVYTSSEAGQHLCRAALVGGKGGQAAAHCLHHSQPKGLVQRRLHKGPMLVCTASTLVFQHSPA